MRYSIALALILSFVGVILAGFHESVERQPEKPPQTLSGLYFERAVSVVKVERDDGGFGTGFFIDEYNIVTANHVIDGYNEVSVYVKGNPTPYIGKVVVASPETDLAIIRVDTPFRSESLTLSERRQQVGDPVYVIGHPYGLEWSLSNGIISHINRKTMEGVLNNVLQIDAPINSGNSGGPVFDRFGEVIGVVSFGAPSADGLGFAIPIRFLGNLL